MDEVRIRIATEYDGKGVDDAVRDRERLERAETAALPAGQGRPGETVSQGGRSGLASSPAKFFADDEAKARAERRAMLRERIRESREREKADLDLAQDAAQEKFNRNLVRQEMLAQREEKQNARGWRGQEAEQRQQFEQAQREEAQRQAQEARDNKKVKKDLEEGAELNARRADHDDSLQALELRAAGHGKEADALERQVAIRSRSRQLQRDLNMDAETATKHAERQVGAEEKISNTRAGRVGPAGAAGAAFDQASGMPAGTIFATLSNPLALAGMAAGAVVGTMLHDQMARASYHAHMEGLSVADANRRAQITSGEFGDSQTDRTNAASSDAEEARTKLKSLRAARGSDRDEGGFGDVAKWGYNAFRANPLSKFSPLGLLARLGPELETSGNKVGREREEEIARIEKATPETEKLAYDQAMKGRPGKELARQKAILAGNSRAARDISYEMLREQKMNEGAKMFGASEEGKKAAVDYAGTAVALARREEQQQFGRIVDARSGAGDTARAADFASGKIEQAVHQLRERVEAQHQQWTLASFAAQQRPRNLDQRR